MSQHCPVEKLGRLHFFHGIILARKVCSSDRRCYYANNKKRFASAQWKTDYLLKQTLLWMKHNWFLEGRLSASLEDSSSSTHTSSSSPTKQPPPTPNSTQMTTITPTQPQPLMPPPTHLKCLYSHLQHHAHHHLCSHYIYLITTAQKQTIKLLKIFPNHHYKKEIH